MLSPASSSANLHFPINDDLLQALSLMCHNTEEMALTIEELNKKKQNSESILNEMRSINDDI